MIPPFLRWAGGKRSMVSILAPILNRALEARGPHAYYVEPFLGAGAVALALARPGLRMDLNDLCAPLTNVWAWIIKAPQSVHDLLVTMIKTNQTEESYKRIRDEFNYGAATPNTLMQAVRFLYLNHQGFNGIWRVNRAGHYNVPYGKRPSAEVPSMETYLAVRAAFRDASFRTGDALERINVCGECDVIFADPPYDNSFNSYGKDGYTAEDQTLLASALRSAAERGAAVVTTNADTHLIRDLYSSWARVHPIGEKRAVAANGDRADAACLVILAGCGWV